MHQGLGEAATIGAGTVIACVAPYVIDGDSLYCRNLGQIRLLGIDAPDRTASPPCRGGWGDHVCDDRAAAAAARSLRAGLRLGPVRIEPAGRDRYRRIIARASAGGTDLSCWQLARGAARYIVRYDGAGLIAAACGVR